MILKNIKMRYLIDTHVLLWMSGEDQNLSETVKTLLSDEKNEIYISIISFWEIAIKHSSGKLKLSIGINDFFEFVLENKIGVLPITFKDVELIDKLPFPKNNGIEHRDPFDRMIIAQAESNELHVISCDSKFDMYQNIVRIW